MIRSTTTTEEGGGALLATVPDFTGLMSQGEFSFGIVSEQGIVLKDDLSEADWRHLLKSGLDIWEKLGTTHLSMSMKVADILNWGEEHLGEKYANEIDLTRNALRQQAKTIENWQWVFKRIPPHLRHPELTYSHHEAAAKLEQDEQKEFLDMAYADGMTVKEMRDAIKERHPGKPRAAKVKTIVAIDTSNPDAITDALQILANHLSNPETEVLEDWKEHMAAIHKVFRRKWQNGHRQ